MKKQKLVLDAVKLILVAAVVLVLAWGAYSLWNHFVPTSKGLLFALQGHGAGIADLDFSPDSTLLASSSADKTVRLWSVVDGEELATFHGHPATVYAACFSPDGQFLASASGLIWAPASPLRFGEPEVAPTDTPAAPPLMSGSYGVIVWDVAAQSPEQVWDSGIPTFAAAYSPDGRILATANGDPMAKVNGSVRLWDISTGKLTTTLWEAANATVWSIGFSRDGTLLASGHQQGVTVWSLKDDQRQAFLPEKATGGVAFSPDGLLLASGGVSGVVHLWSTATYQAEATLTGHTDTIYDLAFSPDGLILASGSGDGTVRLWDVGTKDQLTAIRIPGKGISAVAFSPDGAILATGSSDGLVRLWHVEAVLGR